MKSIGTTSIILFLGEAHQTLVFLCALCASAVNKKFKNDRIHPVLKPFNLLPYTCFLATPVKSASLLTGVNLTGQAEAHGHTQTSLLAAFG